MPLSDAGRLGEGELKPGLIDAYPRRIQIATAFPFVGVEGMDLSRAARAVGGLLRAAVMAGIVAQVGR